MRGSRSLIVPSLDTVPPVQTRTSSFGQLRCSTGHGDPPELVQADSKIALAANTARLRLFSSCERMASLLSQKRYLAPYLRNCEDLVSGIAQAVYRVGSFLEADSGKAVMKFDQQLGRFDW